MAVVDGLHAVVLRVSHRLRLGLSRLGAALSEAHPAPASASGKRRTLTRGAAVFDFHAWGIGGDFMWMFSRSA